MPLPLMFAGLGAKLLLGGSKIKEAAAKIPWQVWAVLAFVIAVGVGSCVHKGKVKEFGEERYAAGKVDGRKERDAEIVVLQKQKAEADRKLAAALRSKADAANVKIDKSAAVILVRGPGKATCANPPAARSGASGHEPAASGANVAGPAVPSTDWAAVPWNWLVKRATEHDKCLIEAGTWRAQKAAEEKAYQESLTHAP